MNFINFSEDNSYYQSPVTTAIIRDLTASTPSQPVEKEVLCEVCNITVSSFVSLSTKTKNLHIYLYFSIF